MKWFFEYLNSEVLTLLIEDITHLITNYIQLCHFLTLLPGSVIDYNCLNYDKTQHGLNVMDYNCFKLLLSI